MANQGFSPYGPRAGDLLGNTRATQLRVEVPRTMLQASPGQASRKPLKSEGRSRITNGTDLLPGIDGRSNWARRFRDVISLHTSDLGGLEECSEAEKSIIR